jgi:hypothetical protein
VRSVLVKLASSRIHGGETETYAARVQEETTAEEINPELIDLFDVI